jgi:hypothetical protein
MPDYFGLLRRYAYRQREFTDFFEKTANAYPKAIVLGLVAEYLEN